ncbi:hypothetical protein [Novosphingobium naphthalenivorans]|uniref:hypothetical protein n=1 Tax=Novosphingobium naphthalenivorans TaxID=273168 RepID=UPI000A74372E|nr:hypothetical protein [Novosphingobium naphthalenivorans]
MANQTKAIEALTNLRELPIGWDYGNGGPISRSTYSSARLLITILRGLGSDDFDVVPGNGDAAVIIAYQGNKSAEISCLSDGTYELLHEEGEQDGIVEASLSLENLICSLEGKGWRSPKFYASCTRSAMLRGSDDIVVTLSRIPRTGAASQWYVRPASPLVTRTHVITSPNSMKNEFVETHQSSGEYQSVPWGKELA